MGVSVNGITENYRERIQRLAIFDPLYRLENKKTKDKSNNQIDYFSLGLLSLLFFFENMLFRNKRTGVKELAGFLQELNQGEIDYNYEDFEKIARTIVQAFRPPTGKRNTKTFYNWETRKMEEVQYSILKAEKADLENNMQYYTLDEQGLELIFATKEYFAEFQLSINQLVLRKQLEKGEFVGALRQIDEMSLDVKNLQDRMSRVKHEIQRSIVSHETYQRYKTIIEDVNLRLHRENDEFEELIGFVRETKEKLGNDMTNDKDRKTYKYVLEIDKELGQVHYEHRLLLKESIVLKTSALQAAKESLYYVGIDSFNFNQEITARVFASPLPLIASRRLIEPFLYLEKKESWSPITVFAKQRIDSTERQEKAEEFLSVSLEEENKKEFIILRNNFKIIMEIVLKTMNDTYEITLEQVIEYIKQNNLVEILNHRTFYDFWIILHQKSPMSLENYDKTQEHLFSGVMELLENKADKLVVEELTEVIKVNDRFTIRNMRIVMEDKDNVL